MNILVIGYGKMGKTIERLSLEKAHHIIGKIDLHNQSSLKEYLPKADVAIEFSTPETAYSNIMTCIESQVPVISGTTGWLDRFEEVVSATKKNNASFFYSSNYSIGVNIFFELNKHLAKIMNHFNEYDVLTEEIHHIEKKDSPSGTAITIAEGIIENMDRKSSWEENQISSKSELSIYSKRIGKTFGIHEVQYHNEIDSVRISHEAFGREGFASGAIRAAEWIIGKKGVFNMDDMLGLTNL